MRWKLFGLAVATLAAGAYFSIGLRNLLFQGIWSNFVCPFLGYFVGICQG